MFLATTKEERCAGAGAVAALLVGFRIDSVQYLRPAAMRGLESQKGWGFEHAEAGLTLRNADGENRSFRWTQRGFDEGLWIGESFETMASGWVPDVNAIPVPSWKAFEGSTISSIAVAWQQIAPARYSIWSVRLDLADRSVAIALGERDSDSGQLTYIPDCVVVIFNDSVGRRYRPPASLSSAWGEEESAESID